MWGLFHKPFGCFLVVVPFFFVGLLFLHHPPIVVVQWKMGCLEYEFPFFYGDFPLNHDYGGKGYT